MGCASCGTPVPVASRNCPVCQTDVGFPNVRAAQETKERAALGERVEDARVSARARKCEAVLDDFSNAVLRSKAVTCRSLSTLLGLVSSDNALYNSFYRQIESGARLPEDSPWDRGRTAVDGTLFPNYHMDIVFAALSLDNRGLANFGKYTIVLKEDMIAHRATVFEENSFIFCQKKHHIVVGDSIPPGYRALWLERARLAMAKLHSRLDAKTSPDIYSQILMKQGHDPAEDDFIEVHIFGPIHRRAIERVIGPKPIGREERALWQSLKRKLDEVGVPLEVL